MKGGKIKMIENTLHNLDVLINNLTDDKEKRFSLRDKCLSIYLSSLYEYEEKHPELRIATGDTYAILLSRRNRYCLSKVHEVLKEYKNSSMLNDNIH